MTHRIERVNHLIREEISELIQRQLKDPRLSSMVAVTDVVTSPDLRQARVFVSCICSPEERQGILNALTSASGFIRNEMGRHLRLRRIPELSFSWDESIERGARIAELIDRVSTEGKPDKK
ncbi:MAG: 30S ribosome-binding factor RbfA [Dehalococcoidia bacterium]|nr:30S ribosome-binding factor RbfA [Dehalococcoidia bacterium]